MKKVCIVVPVYKQHLNPFEKISLQQLLRILGKYPIYLVYPDTVEIVYEELSGWEYGVYQCDNGYFQNTATYSELMLSPFFYEHFSAYQYMLVYQLDCFVFSDSLSDFCDLDYDYIGAPQYHGWTSDAVVGNGGLSLRKIDAVLRVVKKYEEIVREPYYREIFRKWEDNFFSYCGAKKDVAFRVPALTLANTFCTVMDIERGMQDIPHRGLPFGTHAWHRMNFYFWKDIIKAYGYQTDQLLPQKNVDTLERDRNLRCVNYFFDAIPAFSPDKKEELVKGMGFSRNQKYVMWGAGRFGKKHLKVLLDLGLPISDIFDSDPKEEMLYGIPVSYPDYQKIREQGLTVLIGSELYGKEIEQALIKNGCEDFIDLFCLFETKGKILQNKYLKSLPAIEGITAQLSFLEDRSWISEIVRRTQV